MAKYRLNALKSWMEREGIELLVIEDCEERRNAALRYLCGHPSDALFFLHVSGASLLVPWDLPMAELMATADALVAYSSFERSPIKAIAGVARRFGVSQEGRVELPSSIPLPLYRELQQEAPEFEFLCRTDGAEQQLNELRAVKDATELEIYRRGAAITDEIIAALVKGFKEKLFETELDAALFIEAELRKAGGEGTGFETIVANPERSFGIHAFPSFSSGRLDLDGPTIIDFGVKLEGYTTDVTLTLLQGELKPEQERMAELVEEAYSQAEAALTPGATNATVALAVDEFFRSKGVSMPHSLGHAIGLEAHEKPTLKNREGESVKLEPGMILAVEPGLYHPDFGGVRKENDYLITDTGFEKLTDSGIFRI